LYRAEVFPTLRRLTLPILILAGVLMAAIVIGYHYASIYPIPPQALDLQHFTARFGDNLARFGLVSARGAAWIFLTNLRALGIATFLGMFSFGVLGLVLLMTPLGLVGYFAGQMSLAGVSPVLFFLALIAPHGLFEIPAAILEGAAILRLGASVIAPPPGKTLGEGWLAALADWAKVSLAVVMPLLFIAAIVEAFITPRVAVALLGG